MSLNGQNIKALINQVVRNYAVEAFQNMGLNRILLMLTDLADSGGGGGGGSTNPFFVPVTSANFTNATDCPISSLAGGNIAVFYNELGRFLQKDAGEWADLPGGGFKILIPGFDATKGNYHFYAVEDGNGSIVLMVPVTSSNFVNATDCPISTLAGRNIRPFFNENMRFLEKDANEWTDLAGGGFRVLIPGFDSTKQNYHFYAYVV